MDNFSNIIFFGLIIIAVVNNIVKFLKKQNKEQQEVNQPEKKYHQEKNYDEPEYDFFEDTFQPEKVQVKNQSNSFRQTKETEKEQKKRIEVIDDISEEQTENEYRISNLSEAKKAFVYTEIFKRKYES